MTAVLDALPALAPSADLDERRPPFAAPPGSGGAADNHHTGGTGTARPSLLVAGSAGLSGAAAAAMVGGMFAGQGARISGGVAAVGGALWAGAAARSEKPAAWQVGLVPAALVAAAASILPGRPGALGELDALIAAARRSGRSLPPPIPFDPGWRPLLVFAFAVVGFAAGWVATGARRPGLGIALPLPLLVLAAVSLPTVTESSSALVAGTLLFAALCAAHAASSDRAAGHAPLGPRLVRSASALVAVAFVAAAVGRVDALFPPPRVDDSRPLRRQAAPAPAGDAAAEGEATGAGGPGRTAGAFRPNDDIPVELVVPVRRADPVLTYQRVRTGLGTALAGAAAVAGGRLAWPGAARLLRRRRRASWAAARGPRARIAAAYAEWRDLALDLGVAGRGRSPLAFCDVVVADEEHEQLAWLVTRAAYGDLAVTVGDDDARGAEDLSRSLRRRLIAAQPLERRLAARFGRASLRRPYTREVPGALSWRRSGVVRAGTPALPTRTLVDAMGAVR